jgi:ABC-type branched-subunit amino acid transport system substrate-binding protein
MLAFVVLLPRIGIGADVPGVTPTQIVLGQSAAFSGPAAELGTQYRAGAQAYFEYVNTLGGIHKRQIRLITRDDQYEADYAAANTRILISKENVFALFGYVGTPTSNAAVPIVNSAQIPFFAPLTGASSMREPFNRYIFNIRAGYNDETEFLIDRSVRMGVRKIAVFYQNDAYGRAGLSGIESALRKRNLSIIETATVERNSTDVRAAVQKLVNKKPEVIVQISAYSSSAALIQQMREKGYSGQFYNVSFVGGQALMDLLGKDAHGVVISQVVPFPWGTSNPLVAEYATVMRKAGYESLNFSSLEGYIAAKVLVEGLRRAGPDLTREKFISALETINTRTYTLGGFDIQFSHASHNGSSFVEMTVIGVDGKFKN